MTGALNYGDGGEEVAALLDRLIDGELDEPARRQLLERLDIQPDGWRRCAMAFLEAQAWRQELGHLVRAGTGANPSPAPRQHTPWLGASLAVAVSLLMGGLLGMSLDSWLRPLPRSLSEPATIAEEDSHAHKDDGSALVRAADGGDILTGGPDVPARPQPSDPPLLDDLAPAGPDGVYLLVESTEGETLPADVRRALEQLGHQIRQRRVLVPVTVEGGGRVVVPVQEVEIVPVGGQVY